jgi:hypothetical protein
LILVIKYSSISVQCEGCRLISIQEVQHSASEDSSHDASISVHLLKSVLTSCLMNSAGDKNSTAGRFGQPILFDCRLPGSRFARQAYPSFLNSHSISVYIPAVMIALYNSGSVKCHSAALWPKSKHRELGSPGNPCF